MNKAELKATDFYTHRVSITDRRIDKDYYLIEFVEGPLTGCLLAPEDLDDKAGIKRRLIEHAERLENNARALREAAEMEFDIPTRKELEDATKRHEAEVQRDYEEGLI